MRTIGTVLFCVLFLPACASARSEVALGGLPGAGARWEAGWSATAPAYPGPDLRWAVREHLLAMQGAGISVAIASGGEIAFQCAFGYADLEHLARAKPETVYRLASISKPVTAVAVIRRSTGVSAETGAPGPATCSCRGRGRAR